MLSLFLQVPANICLPNMCFSISMNELPSSPLKSKTTTPNFLLCLQLKMALKVRVSNILRSYSGFIHLYHVYILLKFVLFSPVDLSHVNFIPRPARRTLKCRGIFFFLLDSKQVTPFQKAISCINKMFQLENLQSSNFTFLCGYLYI